MTLVLTRARAWDPPSISVDSGLRHHSLPAEPWSFIGPGVIYCVRGHQLHRGSSAPGSYLLVQGVIYHVRVIYTRVSYTGPRSFMHQEAIYCARSHLLGQGALAGLGVICLVAILSEV